MGVLQYADGLHFVCLVGMSGYSFVDSWLPGCLVGLVSVWMTGLFTKCEVVGE